MARAWRRKAAWVREGWRSDFLCRGSRGCRRAWRLAIGRRLSAALLTAKWEHSIYTLTSGAMLNAASDASPVRRNRITYHDDRFYNGRDQYTKTRLSFFLPVGIGLENDPQFRVQRWRFIPVGYDLVGNAVLHERLSL